MNNSLAEVRPELVPEWSEKNLPLKPDEITFGSNKKVWWSLYRRGQLRRRLQAKTVRSRKQQYLWIRYSGILKIPDGVWKIEKMAAQLSSHRVYRD